MIPRRAAWTFVAAACWFARSLRDCIPRRRAWIFAAASARDGLGLFCARGDLDGDARGSERQENTRRDARRSRAGTSATLARGHRSRTHPAAAQPARGEETGRGRGARASAFARTRDGRVFARARARATECGRKRRTILASAEADAPGEPHRDGLKHRETEPRREGVPSRRARRGRGARGVCPRARTEEARTCPKMRVQRRTGRTRKSHLKHVKLSSSCSPASRRIARPTHIIFAKSKRRLLRPRPSRPRRLHRAPRAVRPPRRPRDHRHRQGAAALSLERLVAPPSPFIRRLAPPSALVFA